MRGVYFKDFGGSLRCQRQLFTRKEGSRDNMEFTEPGEIVYSDAKTTLTCHWNFRECDCTIITEDSTLIMLSGEAALKDISIRDLIETLCKIIGYESAFCQGTYSTFILGEINPDVEQQQRDKICQTWKVQLVTKILLELSRGHITHD